jgi:hypothetical protein
MLVYYQINRSILVTSARWCPPGTGLEFPMAGHGCKSDMLMGKRSEEEILLPLGRVRAVTTDILQRVTRIWGYTYICIRISFFLSILFQVLSLSKEYNNVVECRFPNHCIHLYGVVGDVLARD